MAVRKQTGHVEAETTLKASSEVIGSVMIDQTTPGTTNKVDACGAVPVVTLATGAAAIAATYAPGVAFWLHEVTCHFSAAPVTSEEFTVTLDANGGVVYDTVSYRVNPSQYANGDDLEYFPEGGPRLFEAGDAIDIAFPNSDGNTYGVRIVARLA